MADWKQVRRIALALPESAEQVSFDHPSWCVRGKSFAWMRPLRRSDLEALGAAAPDGPILAVRVADLFAKEAVLAAKPKVCFTIPHFDGYAAVLIRLGRISVRDLEDLLVEGWLARAPKTLAREYLGRPRGKGRAKLLTERPPRD